LAGLGSGISLLVFLVISIALFRSTTGWRDKHARQLVLKESKSKARSSARESSKEAVARRQIDGQEQKAVGRIVKQAEKASSSEQKELTAASKRSQARTSALDKQRQRVTKGEASENAKALRILQRDYVDQYKSSHVIGAAQIPGIGQSVARSLAAHGIRSAADFTGIEYQVGPRGGREIRIRTTRFGLVHPSGVGEKKARDLESWRRRVEHEAMATQPTALPAAELNVIRAKYMQQRQAVADQEQTARADAAQERKEIQTKWAATHADFASEIASRRQKFAQERSQIEIRLAAAGTLADTAIWQRELAERELTAHQLVTYGRFLLCIVKP
jgi:hypothetical protein